MKGLRLVIEVDPWEAQHDGHTSLEELCDTIKRLVAMNGVAVGNVEVLVDCACGGTVFLHTMRQYGVVVNPLPKYPREARHDYPRHG